MRVMSPEEAKRFEENEQIQYVVKKFQEGMNKFDTLQLSVNSTRSEVKAISDSFVILKDTCTPFFQALETLKRQMMDQSATIDSHAFSFAASVAPIAKDITQLKAQFGDIQGQIAPLSGQISNLKDIIPNLATTAHFSELKQSIKNTIDEVRSKYQTHEEKFISFTNKVDSHMQFSQSLSQDMANLNNNHARLSLDIKNLASDIDLGKRYLESCLGNLQPKLIDHVAASIAAIPKPIIPSLEDAKKAVDEKLVPAALDAKNANLRSANNEQKITILEKRVEQLQLLLNKLQIQG